MCSGEKKTKRKRKKKKNEKIWIEKLSSKELEMESEHNKVLAIKDLKVLSLKLLMLWFEFYYFTSYLFELNVLFPRFSLSFLKILPCPKPHYNQVKTFWFVFSIILVEDSWLRGKLMLEFFSLQWLLSVNTFTPKH